MTVSGEHLRPDECPFCESQNDCSNDCPIITNIFPITEIMLGEQGMVCPACGEPFALGDHYTTIAPPPDHPAVVQVRSTAREMFGDDSPPIRFAICLGCGVTGRVLPDE